MLISCVPRSPVGDFLILAEFVVLRLLFLLLSSPAMADTADTGSWDTAAGEDTAGEDTADGDTADGDTAGEDTYSGDTYSGDTEDTSTWDSDTGVDEDYEAGYTASELAGEAGGCATSFSAALGGVWMLGIWGVSRRREPRSLSELGDWTSGTRGLSD